VLQPSPIKKSRPKIYEGRGEPETMKNNSMIDANQRVHLVDSERYATLLKKVKHGFETSRGGFWLLALEKH
jgi:hypothetical protein